MKPFSLDEQWARQPMVLNGFLAIPSAWTAELMAHCGYDALTIDIQHGLIDYAMALQMLQAISTTTVTPLVRLTWSDPDVIMKMLDAGAMGLICPMIETAEDCHRFVQASKYPPQGIRSFGPYRPQLLHGADYFFQANRMTKALAMIETAKALDHVEQIAAVPHLDGLFVGPYDLSVSLGIEPKGDLNHPQLQQAILHILEVAKKQHLRAGIYTSVPAFAQMATLWGFDLVSFAFDTSLLQQAATTEVKRLKEKLI